MARIDIRMIFVNIKKIDIRLQNVYRHTSNKQGFKQVTQYVKVWVLGKR